jgi:hypothetical protein
MSTEPRNEELDVEGHTIGRHRPDDNAETPDVEGHGASRPHRPADGEETPDVEGH